MNLFIKSFASFGAAVFVHVAVAWGVVGLGASDSSPPIVLSGFEVVELPSSASTQQPEAVEEIIEDPADKVEPTPVVMAKPEPSPQPTPKIKPQPQPKPKPKVKIKAKTQPLKGADAVAAEPAYVPPSQHAVYLKNPKPAYPTQARKRGMEGRVVLRVLVRSDGAVKGVELQQSSGYGLLDRAARVAVLRWRFAPATQSGRVVDGEVLIPFDFRLTSG